MLCPHCGTSNATPQASCSSCGRRITHRAQEVATGVLTPPPPPGDKSDQTRLVGAPDETRLVDASDQTRFDDSADQTRFDDTPDQTRLVDTSDQTRLVEGPGGAETYPPRLSSREPVKPATGGRPVSHHAGVTPGPPLDTAPYDHVVAAPRRRTGATPKEGPLEIGQAFGTRYHIIKVLGVGGMGAVYQAWDAELGVSVAVKVIRPEIAADPKAAAEIERRFKRELLLARQVTHRNVVRIHDLGEIDGIKYITMPYVEGSDLATILKKETKLPVPRALRLARGIVSGLVAAHEAGVVHRDLKPANIMVGPDDDPVIMDFGIARSTSRDSQGSAPVGPLPPNLSPSVAILAGATQAGAIIGTVEYMAPEQVKGQPVDQRADIYAFGLILYDLLIGGRRSDRAESAIAELQSRMQAAPAPPRSVNPEIPEAIDAIIIRCLEPDPDKRFKTTLELQAAFERLDEKGKPLPIIRRVTRRAMIATALVVALLLGGTFYVTKRLSVPPREPDPVTVVVADFQNNTGDPAFDNTLGQTLKRALEGASFISAYDRTRIRSTFGVPPPEKFDETAARQLAIKQGLGVILAGSIGPRGNGFELTVQATQPLTGEVITSERRRASSKDQVLDTLTRMVASIRKTLGDETSASDQLLAMRTLSTTSLEVASHYAAGVEAQARGRNAEAFEQFTKAVELDPKFGIGYQALAVVSRNLGRLQESDKYAAEALRYIDGMTERESLMTRAYYYIRAGDYQQCEKEYAVLIARYPGDVVARSQRARCLSRLRQMRQAVEEMQQVVKVLPSHRGFRTNLSLFMSYAGDFRGAEQEIRSMGEPTARALGALALSQLGQGRTADAAETYRQVSTMDPWGASYGPAGLGDLAIYEGRFSEGIRILEQGVAADLASKNPDLAAMKLAATAHAHLTRGQKATAAATAEKALQLSKAVPIRFLAGRVLAETGKAAQAQKLAAEFLSQVSAEQQAYGKLIEGAIALHGGNAQQAIKILTDANGILDTWIGHFDVGRAFFAIKAYPQADSEFDRCIQRRGEALAVVDEDPTYAYFPAVYYYRGRVREQMNTASFADAYREYLSIRGQSTDDPLVSDARKRIGN